VYGGSSLFAFFRPPLIGGGILLLALLPVGAFKDVQRQKQLKYGRRLKGPEMLTPKQFNKTVKGDGIGFKTNDIEPMLRIPSRAEQLLALQIRRSVVDRLIRCLEQYQRVSPAPRLQSKSRVA